MPSTLVDNAYSGGMPLISGIPFSGGQTAPQSMLLIKASRNNSGCVYVNFSGALAVNSGGFPLSGGGMLDGMEVGPGGSYSVPKLVFDKASLSGSYGVYVACDAAASGRARVFWEFI